jgi:hypothetical protein
MTDPLVLDTQGLTFKGVGDENGEAMVSVAAAT